MSVLFGAGIILPATGSVRSFGMLDYLRYTWKSMEVKEILSASPVKSFHLLDKRRWFNNYYGSENKQTSVKAECCCC